MYSCDSSLVLLPIQQGDPRGLNLEDSRRVGIQLPSVEVRFQDLTVEAQAEAAGRELPSIFNSYRNWVEVSIVPCT